MSRTKIVFTAFATLCLAATLTGCHRGASRPILISVSPNTDSQAIGSLGVLSSGGMTPSFVSLGAGDALGWAVHQKDVELARAASVETTLCAK
ncbi:MAG: hypothetical protein U0640_00820 [Phycisphaerales bacterium]